MNNQADTTSATPCLSSVRKAVIHSLIDSWLEGSDSTSFTYTDRSDTVGDLCIHAVVFPHSGDIIIDNPLDIQLDLPYTLQTIHDTRLWPMLTLRQKEALTQMRVHVSQSEHCLSMFITDKFRILFVQMMAPKHLNIF
jgi:hypothetical protein